MQKPNADRSHGPSHPQAFVGSDLKACTFLQGVWSNAHKKSRLVDYISIAWLVAYTKYLRIYIHWYISYGLLLLLLLLWWWWWWWWWFFCRCCRCPSCSCFCCQLNHAREASYKLMMMGCSYLASNTRISCHCSVQDDFAPATGRELWRNWGEKVVLCWI